MICRKCGSESRLVKDIKTDGSEQFWFKCLSCEANAKGPGTWIPKRSIINPDKVEINNDYRTDTDRCAVIGCNEPAQDHHWAPRHIFGAEAENWPRSYLCLKHHDLWHRLVEGDNRCTKRRDSLEVLDSVPELQW